MSDQQIASLPPVLEIFALHGKTAIVTGATGGIGLEMCLALADAGADIVSIQIPNDPQGPALEQAISGKQCQLQVFEGDISDTQSIRATFARMWEAGVVPDILLNCAGMSLRGKVENMSDEAIDKVFNLNLRGSFIVSQEFGKRLIQLGRPGKIILIASMASYMAQVNVSVYGTSKAGVRHLTKALSNEWASKGIQCNSISPGWIQTRMTQNLWENPEYNKNLLAKTPAGRWGFPEDLKGTVLFLASKASDFVTGISIVVDGGVLGGLLFKAS